MCNLDVREYAKQKGVKLWEVARMVGVNDSNFSRRLRTEFSPEEKKRVKGFIDQIAKERGC
ncbi:MAG: hypothetical protein IJ359_02230 [Erysipelotrichaceae bacterium]|nr:hypothetical protein [Erysipelotrichaceae bacterium]